jgi:MYXO-CTERM domain-containing protein
MAGLEACGNIDVSANATCKVETQGGCTAKCEPVNFELACAAKLEAQCNGECTATADVQCAATCKADCTGQCTANPGNLDCNASCEGRCDGDCEAKCASNGNKSECVASCKACCSGHCDAQCTGKPPTASCEAKCEGSCQGSCEAKANVDCQVSCQSKLYAGCKSSLSGGCTTQCSKPEGALFCDGEYVDTGNNLQNCIDALNAVLNVKVQASGSASCAGNECNAEGTASASCASAPATDGVNGGAIFAGLGLVAVAATRRRKRAGR